MCLFHKGVSSTFFVPGPVIGAGVTMVGTRFPAVTPDNHVGKTGDDDDDDDWDGIHITHN